MNHGDYIRFRVHVRVRVRIRVMVRVRGRIMVNLMHHLQAYDEGGSESLPSGVLGLYLTGY